MPSTKCFQLLTGQSDRSFLNLGKSSRAGVWFLVALFALSCVILWTASAGVAGVVGLVCRHGAENGLNVCYIVDRRACDFALVSMLSIVRQSPRVVFDFFILHPDWEPWNMTRFEVVAKLGKSRTHSVPFSREDMRVERFRGDIVLVKFWLYRLLPNVSRVLFLDADTIAWRPITPLFRLDLTEATVAAVRAADCYPRRWMNSGVVLYNLELMRALEFWKRTSTCLRNYTCFLDDAWHTVCHRDTTIELPYRYNIMVHAVSVMITALRGEKKEAVIFHFMKEAKQAFNLDSEQDIDTARALPPLIDKYPMKRWMSLRQELRKIDPEI